MGGIDVNFIDIEPAMQKQRRQSLEPVTQTVDVFKEALSTYAPYRGQVENGSNLALIFAGDDELNLLKQFKESIYVDGTFKVVPIDFYQLVSILVLKDEVVLPAVFALMTSKARILYDAVFAFVKNIAVGTNPNRIFVILKLGFSILSNFHSPWCRYSRMLFPFCAGDLAQDYCRCSVQIQTLNYGNENLYPLHRCLRIVLCLFIQPICIPLHFLNIIIKTQMLSSYMSIMRITG